MVELEKILTNNSLCFVFMKQLVHELDIKT